MNKPNGVKKLEATKNVFENIIVFLLFILVGAWLLGQAVLTWIQILL